MNKNIIFSIVITTILMFVPTVMSASDVYSASCDKTGMTCNLLPSQDWSGSYVIMHWSMWKTSPPGGFYTTVGNPDGQIGISYIGNTPPWTGVWYGSWTGTISSSSAHNLAICSFSSTGGMLHTRITAIVSDTSYTLTGSGNCVNYMQLAVWDNADWIDVFNDTSPASYSITIANDTQYKMTYSNGHTYEFTCTGDVVYNYDACAYYVLNFYDDCHNHLINATVTVYDVTDDTYPAYQLDPSWYWSDGRVEMQIGKDVNISDEMEITFSTKTGDWFTTNIVEEKEVGVYDNEIDWSLDVTVIDDVTGSAISQAKVTKSQTCSCIAPNTGYKLTSTNGKTTFIGLANQNIVLIVEKSGYNTYSNTLTVGKTFHCWATGGAVTVSMNATSGNSTDNYQNGTHNDSAADGTGEETLPSDHEYGCGVYFKNTVGKIVSTIEDTDTHVDMYYWTKGCNATLKFQHQLYTYWYTDASYSVTNNTYEYRRIMNADFSDHTNAYRGYLYNSTCDCNSIQNLKVINTTYEESTHYENLSAHCQFAHKLGGNEIDYRSDIEVRIYANSSNSSLLNITAHLMNQSALVDTKVLNWADFSTGTPKWWYVWYPTYEYTSGYNYTVNITGYDGYQLDTDEVWTTDIVGNTLTVNVKDNHGTPLSHSTVFIEEWGSIATDVDVFASVSGLPDGNIQYKATKSGYTSSGWNTVVLSGADQTVTCVLVSQSAESITNYKLKDSEIKEFFIPLIYMLFIMMIIGGLMNAAKP